MSVEPARDSSLAPVVDARTRVLVLGSLPGQVSLRERRYYANPTNQFWRLLGPVAGSDLAALDYERRLSAVAEAGIGLWDVVKSARRAGSLDANLREHQANALAEQAAALPSLRAIGFNGGAAARIGRGQLAATRGLALLDLPSSSAAYCAMSLDRKLAAWSGLREFLMEA